MKTIKKVLLLVVVIIIVVLGVLGGIKYFTSSNQEQVEQDQPIPTSVRHDNSGAGANTQDDSGENHFNRALQHFGL